MQATLEGRFLVLIKSCTRVPDPRRSLCNRLNSLVFHSHRISLVISSFSVLILNAEPPMRQVVDDVNPDD